MERVWGTLQQRLPPLLRLEEIKTVEAANRFLAETYVVEHNQRFAVASSEEGDAFVPFVERLAILCVKQERGEQRQLRCALRRLNHKFQNSATAVTMSRVTPFRVRQYADGALSIFHGPRRLADYTADGALITEETARQSAA